METREPIDEILQLLPDLRDHHAPGSRVHTFLKRVARAEVEELFSTSETVQRPFGDFGPIVFPYFSMGAVDSRNLFDIDELILFSFYLRNKSRYHRAADIGANIGLHSILLSKCGMSVRAFEPDPTHFRRLRQNIEANLCQNIESFNCAVSDHSGEMEFVRVEGNTTGSHLAGSKTGAYGKLQRFPVKVEAISGIIEWADFMKLDAEGHEMQIILATDREQWNRLDAMVEVENAENARRVFEHLDALGVKMYAQKIGWRQARATADLPTSYKEGMMFVSCKKDMPWE